MKPFEQTYQILSTLGKGGMGSVYLVRHLRLGTLWAMKEVEKRVDETIDLLGEANMLKRLNHISLPRIIDIYEDANCIYIVEDYIEGVSLDRKLAEKGRFPESQVRVWAAQLCDVLQYLHEQKPNPIIYRDMKPGNIMLTPNGLAKLVDFGIAREYKKDTSGDTLCLGTRGYAAPEQFGTSQTDARTDIYSLGVTLYHLLTGKSPNDPPYELVPIRQIDPSLSEGMEYIIAKCTRGNPNERYQNMYELERDIINIDSFSALARRQKCLGALKAAGCCILIIGGASLALLGFQSKQTEANEAYERQYEYGITLLSGGNFDKAKAVLLEADAESTGKVSGHIAVAAALIDKGDWASCIEFSEESAASLPELNNSAEFNYWWGVALDNIDDYSSALKKFKKADSIDSGNTLYMRYLARAYAETGDMGSANSILNELEQIADDGTINYVYASISEMKGDADGAITGYQECLNSSDDDELEIASYRALAKLYGDLAESEPSYLYDEIGTLKSMQSAYPNNEEAFILDSLGKAYFSKGIQENNDEALRSSVSCFDKIISLGYERASSYLNKALVERRLKDFGAAEKTLLQLLDHFPTNADACIQMGFLIAERENTKIQSERDYSGIQQYYDMALEYKATGTDLERLEGLVSDLKAGGWL